MPVIEKLRGITGSLFSFGLANVTTVLNLKNNAGIFEVRNAADAAYIIGRGADPVGDDDWVTRRYFLANASSANYTGIRSIWMEIIPPVEMEPVGTGWAVTSLAQLNIDTNTTGVTVAQFDPVTEEGLGRTTGVPSNALGLRVHIEARSETAQVGDTTSIWKLYARPLTCPGAPGAWSAAIALFTITHGPDENFDAGTSADLTLAVLGITAGNMCQLEITRQLGTLPVDATVQTIVIEWY